MYNCNEYSEYSEYGEEKLLLWIFIILILFCLILSYLFPPPFEMFLEIRFKKFNLI